MAIQKLMGGPRFLIYRINNQKNGRYYVGAHTCVHGEHCPYLGSGTAIRRAIRRHGTENFTKEIVAEANSEQSMWLLEKLMVVTVDQDPASYNLMMGGFGGGEKSRETRRKMAAAQKKYYAEHPHHLTGTKRPEFGARQKGVNNPFYGRNHSDDFKQRQAATVKLRHRRLKLTKVLFPDRSCVR